jgi:poly(3-hydroxybutyrate) depolymerase
MRNAFLCLLAVVSLPALAEDPSQRKLKTDSAVRARLIRDFLAGDEAKRAAAIEQAGKWVLVPGSAAKELEVLRKWAPARPLPVDAKKQPVRRRDGKESEKFKEGGKDFEYAWSVPKEYDGTKPAPLWIYLHGSNGPMGMGVWEKWAAAQGAILVAPASPNRTYWHPVDGATDPKEYEETFFFTQMKAWREKFNVDHNRVYLSGFSAGGFGSWWFSLRYPDWWAAVMPMAGGPPANWGERGPYEHVGKLPYWVWHGDEDKDVPVELDRKGVEWLRKLGTPCEYKEYKGGDHNTWFGKDPEIAKIVQDVVAKQRRIVWPKRVVWTWDALFLKTFPGITLRRGAWWLEMVEHGDTARIEAELVEPNVVDVKVKAVTKFRILVFANVFDLTKEITVRVGGAEAWKGVVEIDYATLLSEFNARPDPDRLVCGEIVVTVPGK